MKENRPAESTPGPSSPEPAAEARPKRSEWEVAERKRRNATIARLIVGLVLLVLFVIFVSLNSDSVPVHFIFVETSTPLVWVFLVCALIGALVAFLLGRAGRRSSRKYIKELERRLDAGKRS